MDLAKEAAFIAQRVVCSLEVTIIFVELEDTYYDILSLNVYDNDYNSGELHSDIVVEDDELLNYI